MREKTIREFHGGGATIFQRIAFRVTGQRGRLEPLFSSEKGQWSLLEGKNGTKPPKVSLLGRSRMRDVNLNPINVLQTGSHIKHYDN